MKGFNKNLIKLSYTGEPKFFINEKKGTVTCKMSAVLNGPCEIIDSFIGGDVSFPSSFMNSTGVARCHEGDVFDVEIGKRIALSKAENCLYNNAAIKVSEYCEKLDFMRSVCNEFAAKSFRCQAHNLDYIDSLTMPAHPKFNNNPLPRKRGTVVSHIKA